MSSPNSLQPAPEKEIARSKCPNDLVHSKVGQLYHKYQKKRPTPLLKTGRCVRRDIHAGGDIQSSRAVHFFLNGQNCVCENNQGEHRNDHSF
ncbi:hypothetical protein TNCV_2754751 [Trichonephila clavipes]|nr:hypothetical protein TNCV_2754751 [Trichonephila clavipes]